MAIVTMGMLAAYRGATGDVLRLADGDTLSGDLVEIADGTAVFHTALAGQLMLAVEEVASVSTEHELYFLFTDGTAAIGRLVERDNRQFLLARDGRNSAEVDLTAISSTAPAPNTAERDNDKAERQWDTQLATGYRWRWNSLDYSEPFMRIDLLHQGPRYEFRGLADLEYADQGQFPRSFRADAAWRPRQPRPLFPRIDIGVERAIQRALRLRADLALGVGKTLVSDRAQELEVGAGLNAAFEYLDLASWLEEKDDERPVLFDLARNGETIWGRYAFADLKREEQDLSLRIHLRYDREILGSGRLAENLVLYPSLTDLGELRGRAESSLLLPLSSRLDVRLGLSLDFDSDPVFKTIDDWETAVDASVVWRF
ncbi:MAG TPA: DUF481 domain-containing protein [Candidatus Hydrogenedentes bacterium]|nr:DUF481 domain-containing protein [Candidatus Hydrogenedentota bacterium]